MGPVRRRGASFHGEAFGVLPIKLSQPGALFEVSERLNLSVRVADLDCFDNVL